MPPKECKIVRELDPKEKHLLKLHEKRERLKAIKNKTQLNSVLKDRSEADISKVDQFVFTDLDKVIRPEAVSGQLDLSRNEFHVNDDFSVERSRRLNDRSADRLAMHTPSMSQTVSVDAYDS